MSRRRNLLIALACIAGFTGVGVAVLWQVANVLGVGSSRVTGRQVDQRPLEKAIERAASERPTEVVDVADFVRAEWDRVEVFGGYTTGGVVSEEIGRDWGEGHETDQIAYEHENALVFVRRGEVVAWLGHLDAASFECVKGAGRVLRFYVREWIESDGRPYRLLVPARSGGMRSPAARACVRRHGPLAGS